MRVIVTGSRTWEGIGAVARLRSTLDHLMLLAGYTEEKPLQLVHGACPKGADACADQWAAMTYGVPEPERHPAFWDQFGKAAGHFRNEHMANLGADLCVAFLRDNSRGTINMIHHARRVGIYVMVVPWVADIRPTPVILPQVGLASEWGDAYGEVRAS